VTRRPPLYRREARTIEHLIGLRPCSLLAVERRANGDYALIIRGQLVGGRWRRVIRLPAKRVEGYRPRSATVRPRDVRARRRANARRTALWLMNIVDVAPVVERVFFGDHWETLDELRYAVQSLGGDPSIGDQVEWWLASLKEAA
jgi:hypothetical protein